MSCFNYVNYFQRKYPYIDEVDIEVLEGGAKETLIHRLYGAYKNVSTEDKEWAFENYKYWILRAMQEMIERLGVTSAISYTENGISITFDETQLSSSLLSEIIPFARTK